MDHIFSADEQTRFQQFIPALPWLGYDHKPSTTFGRFKDYAIQRGWDKAKLQSLKKGQLEDLDKAALLPFLQSWFSLGLWEAALGQGLNLGDFLVSRQSKSFFTSEPVLKITEDLNKRFQDETMDDPGKQDFIDNLARVLRKASKWNRILAEPRFIDGNQDFCNADYQMVHRIFSLLGVALQYLGEQLTGYTNRSAAALTNLWSNTKFNEKGLVERMEQRGWCPYIRTMLHPFNRFVVEYATVVGPPSTFYEHDKCSKRQCIRHNTDETTYKPAHTTPGCQCLSVKPNFANLANILNENKIPLVDLSSICETENHKRIAVVRNKTGEVDFTAISHVWSGGLGSTAEEGLPECALRQVGDYLPSTNGQKLVWIDALCIPAEKTLRKLSIIGMNKVYSEALRTLVIDPELSRAPPESWDLKQFLLYIMTSAWMQRMWTLPEGRLSKNIHLASTGADSVWLLQVYQSANENWDNPVVGALFRDLYGLFQLEPLNLRYVQQSTCYRTTSKVADEILALSTLFGLDTQPLLEKEDLEERMSMFWLAVSHVVSIPVNILYLRGQKLQRPGFRWAPKSLLDSGRQLTLSGDGKSGPSSANISENGAFTATLMVIRLKQRISLLLNGATRLHIVFVPSPSENVRVSGEWTILFYDDTGESLEKEGRIDDIDAFAVNVWNSEARFGRDLAAELIPSVRTALAMTEDTIRGDVPASHAYRACHRCQISPIRVRGERLAEGVAGWARISIS